VTDNRGDRCPYCRPFPDDFRTCAAYQPAHFVPLDMSYRPLATVWACVNLEPGGDEPRHRFYPRCRIGDEQARRDWVEAQRHDRLAALRRLQDELNPKLAELVALLWSEKARQLRSESGDVERRTATARLYELRGHFLVTLERFLEDHAELLTSLGFPLEACMRLYKDLLDGWIEQPNAEVPEIPDSALEPFPPDTRVFFKPDYGAART
jgi:hypothetical protein